MKLKFCKCGNFIDKALDLEATESQCGDCARHDTDESGDFLCGINEARDVREALHDEGEAIVEKAVQND